MVKKSLGPKPPISYLWFHCQQLYSSTVKEIYLQKIYCAVDIFLSHKEYTIIVNPYNSWLISIAYVLWRVKITMLIALW